LERCHRTVFGYQGDVDDINDAILIDVCDWVPRARSISFSGHETFFQKLDIAALRLDFHRRKENENPK
jgi:hypothetical protein